MKHLLFAVIAIVLMSQVAFAQSEAVAIATGAVETTLLIEGQDADWGIFGTGVTYVITAYGFKNPPGPGEAAGDEFDALGFLIEGSANAEILVNFVFPTGLDNVDLGGSRIALNNWQFGWNYDQDPTATFAQSGPVVGNSMTLPLGIDGVVGIFLGCTATVPPTAQEGGYEGQVIGIVSYTAQ
jgi:hypothetical protein